MNPKQAVAKHNLAAKCLITNELFEFGPHQIKAETWLCNTGSTVLIPIEKAEAQSRGRNDVGQCVHLFWSKTGSSG